MINLYTPCFNIGLVIGSYIIFILYTTIILLFIIGYMINKTYFIFLSQNSGLAISLKENKVKLVYKLSYKV